MGHTDGKDEYVTWKYKDLPRPPTHAPCKKTLTLKDIVRDCEKPKPSGISRLFEGFLRSVFCSRYLCLCNGCCDTGVYDGCLACDTRFVMAVCNIRTCWLSCL